METRLVPMLGAAFYCCSHSLGTLIEWKLKTLLRFSQGESSHSLGTLIEWKQVKIEIGMNTTPASSHSLGTLIEWKRESAVRAVVVNRVPTRWGH